MGENYNVKCWQVIAAAVSCSTKSASMDENLHSPQRRLIELRIEHADLDSLIDRAALEPQTDELVLRRLKKRRLMLRDQISRLEAQLEPPEPA
jgi:hypothetical protein